MASERQKRRARIMDQLDAEWWAYQHGRITYAEYDARRNALENALRD